MVRGGISTRRRVELLLSGVCIAALGGCERERPVEMVDATTADLQRLISERRLVKPGKYRGEARIEQLELAEPTDDDVQARAAVAEIERQMASNRGWNFDLCTGDDGVPAEMLITSAKGCTVPWLRLAGDSLRYRLRCPQAVRGMMGETEVTMRFTADGYVTRSAFSVSLPDREGAAAMRSSGSGTVRATWVGECGRG